MADAGRSPGARSLGAKPAAARAAEAAERTRKAAAGLRHAREQLRRVSAEVARTEARAAETFRRAAQAAQEQGRTTDAARLRRRAQQAEGFAEHERRQSTDSGSIGDV